MFSIVFKCFKHRWHIMTTMIERVAEAMARSDGFEIHERGYRRDLYRRRARAAIQAMREPTDAMKEAGRPWECADGPDAQLLAAEDCWGWMIDAALDEER